MMPQISPTIGPRRSVLAWTVVFAACGVLALPAGPACGQSSRARAATRQVGGGKKGTPAPTPLLDLSKLAPRKAFELRGHTKPVNRVSFNFDGTLLASGGEDGKVIVWDMRGGAKLEILDRPDFVRGLTFSPLPSNTLFSARATPWSGVGGSGAVTLYDVDSSDQVELHSRASWAFFALAVNRPVTLAAGGGADRALKVFDLRRVVSTRKERGRTIPEYFEFTPPALPDEIHCLDFYPKRPSTPLIAVGCRDGSVKLFQIRGVDVDAIRPVEVPIETQRGPVRCVKFSPDGKLLAITGSEGIIVLRNAISGALVRTIDSANAPLNWLSFSPDSQLLADARTDKTIHLWKVATGEELSVLRAHTGAVRGVEFGADGKRLASCDEDFVVIAWSLFPSEPPSSKGAARKRKG